MVISKYFWSPSNVTGGVSETVKAVLVFNPKYSDRVQLTVNSVQTRHPYDALTVFKFSRQEDKYLFYGRFIGSLLHIENVVLASHKNEPVLFHFVSYSTYQGNGFQLSFSFKNIPSLLLPLEEEKSNTKFLSWSNIPVCDPSPCGGNVTLSYNPVDFTFKNGVNVNRTCIWLIRTTKEGAIGLTLLVQNFTSSSSLAIQQGFSSLSPTTRQLFLTKKKDAFVEDREIVIDSEFVVLTFTTAHTTPTGAGGGGQGFVVRLREIGQSNPSVKNLKFNFDTFRPKSNTFSVIEGATVGKKKSSKETERRFMIIQPDPGQRVVLHVDFINLCEQHDMLHIFKFSAKENTFIRLHWFTGGLPKNFTGGPFYSKTNNTMLIYFESVRHDFMVCKNYKFALSYSHAIRSGAGARQIVDYKNPHPIGQPEGNNALGNWGPVEYCPEGSIVSGFDVKYVPYRGSPASVGQIFAGIFSFGIVTAINAGENSFDDYGVVGVKLDCANPRTGRIVKQISSKYFSDEDIAALNHVQVTSRWIYGHLSLYSYGLPDGHCKETNAATGFRLKTQPFQGSHDDFGVINFKLICQGRGGQLPDPPIVYDTIADAPWTEAIECPPGHLVCGIQTKMHDVHYKTDSAGLTDVKLECCPFSILTGTLYGSTDVENEDEDKIGVTLTGSILRLDFDPDTSNRLESSVKKRVQMQATLRIRNDGQATYTKEVTATKAVVQRFEFEKSSSTSNMHHVGIETTFEACGGASVPFVADGSIKAGLNLAYNHEWTRGSETRVLNGTEETKTFEVKDSVAVPPCTEYLVDTFVSMVNNVEIHYQLHMKISGMRGEQRLNAHEIQAELQPGMIFDKIFDPFTILARTRGRMVANAGIESYSVGKGTDIEGCGQKI